jgi:hypothetical protein
VRITKVEENEKDAKANEQALDETCAIPTRAIGAFVIGRTQVLPFGIPIIFPIVNAETHVPQFDIQEFSWSVGSATTPINSNTIAIVIVLMIAIVHCYRRPLPS